MGIRVVIQNGEWVRWTHGGHMMIGRIMVHLPDKESYQVVLTRDDIYKGMIVLVPQGLETLDKIIDYCPSCGRYDL